MAKRAAQQGADAAEEFLDETTERVRRHPVETNGDHVCRGPHRRDVDRLDAEAKVAQSDSFLDLIGGVEPPASPRGTSSLSGR